MTCLDCLCLTLACQRSCLHCSLKHPSLGLDDPFPLAEEREFDCINIHGMRVSTSTRVTRLGITILKKPNFASTFVTISRRASSKVRRRLELRIRCFSSSSGANASRPASLVTSFILFFDFPSFCDTADSQRSIPAWSSRREHRPGETIVRRRFLFLPPAVGSYLFCSRCRTSNGFFRWWATMSFASQLVRAISAVCICCKTNSRFCTHRSWFVMIGRNSRSMNSVENSVVCSAALEWASFRTWAVVRWLDHLHCCCNLDSCSNLRFESEQLLLKLNHHWLHHSHRSTSG